MVGKWRKSGRKTSNPISVVSVHDFRAKQRCKKLLWISLFLFLFLFFSVSVYSNPFRNENSSFILGKFYSCSRKGVCNGKNDFYSHISCKSQEQSFPWPHCSAEILENTKQNVKTVVVLTQLYTYLQTNSHIYSKYIII